MTMGEPSSAWKDEATVRHPRIKICGLRTPEAVDAVLRRGGPEVGFVHFARSPRHLSLPDMVALRAYVGDRAAVTVVTVDPDDALLEAIRRDVRPDTIQLHGSETAGRVAEIGRRTGLATMKALSVHDARDIAAVAAYRGIADRLLLDAKAPKGAALPGGNGVAFDWRLLAGLPPGLDYMLSGGLTPDNVGAAIRQAAPPGLDVSSGVESAPGVKDIDRINQFFDAVLAALQPLEGRRAS